MNCPRCEIKLKEINLAGIEIDICSQCDGVWFDVDELDRVYNFYGDSLEHTALAPAIALQSSHMNEKEGEKKLKCARCNKLMLRKKFDDDCSVLIDGCEQGCGMWLDGGELGTITRYISKKRNLDNPEHETDLLLKAIKEESKIKEEKESTIKEITSSLSWTLQKLYRKLYKLDV